jgi:HPr kinase/phosphorylase
MSEIHASCVAADGRALLILGRPGAGKSSLALELVALGAVLVADDRVALRREGAALLACAPPRLRGLIEARGVGVLRLPHAAEAAVALAVDLGATEDARIPPRRSTGLLGAAIPLLLGRPAGAALIAALRHGPPLDPEAALPEG